MHRVLILTVGETPQIVTETVYALATGASFWLPGRIILATTERGAGVFNHGDARAGGVPLLGAGGKLAELMALLGADPAAVKVQTLLAAHPDGRHFPDVRSETEVFGFADTLLAAVRETTSDPEAELHLSLAGGRKTMSAIACQIMSLCGRRQDVLSHVLVEPIEFEHRRDFWWPSDGEGRVLLHEVPYFRIRAWLEDRDLFPAVETSYAQAVARANDALVADKLVIDLASRVVSVDKVSLQLDAAHIALLATVAIACKRGQAMDITSVNGVPALALGTDLNAGPLLLAWLQTAARLKGPELPGDFDYSVGWRVRAFKPASIQQRVSRLRAKCRQQFPPRLAERIVRPDAMATGFAPANIRIIVPAFLAGHPDCPSEVEPP